MTYQVLPNGKSGTWSIFDAKGLRALDVSNKRFVTEADAKVVILEHEAGIRKGHWDLIPHLLTDEGLAP